MKKPSLVLNIKRMCVRRGKFRKEPSAESNLVSKEREIYDILRTPTRIWSHVDVQLTRLNLLNENIDKISKNVNDLSNFHSEVNHFL